MANRVGQDSHRAEAGSLIKATAVNGCLIYMAAGHPRR